MNASKSYGERTVGDALRMMEEKAPLSEVVDAVWFGFLFHTETPLYYEGLLPLALRMYERCKSDQEPDGVAQCMLLLGRIYSAKGALLPACRFYRTARKTFKDPHGIIAMEFFREELRSDAGKQQIGLSSSQFEAKYINDTPDLLIGEYGTGEGSCGA